MTTCPACGFQMAEGARFCAMCGERLAVGESTTTMAPLEDQTLTNDLNSEEIGAIDALPAGSALLVVLKGPGAGSRFLLHDAHVVAGRDPQCAIFLDDITVSRSHVAFTRDQGSYLIEDLGSLNGTYVNRHLLKGPTLLRNGDEVQIGKYRMVIFLGLAGTE